MEPYELRRGPWKNLTLRVLAPDGRLRVSAPRFIPRLFIDRFVADRADWIARRREALAQASAEAVRGPVDRVWVWGEARPLRIESPGRLPRVVLDPADGAVVLRVPASWTPERHQKALDRWEKERVETALETLVPLWERRTGLKVARWTVKKMVSRWGSCRPDAASVVLNSRLGAFPPVCLEHVLVHELAHLVERGHNPRFHALVEGWLPGAAAVRKLLRAGPAGPAVPGVSPGLPSSSGGGREP